PRYPVARPCARILYTNFPDPPLRGIVEPSTSYGGEERLPAVDPASLHSASADHGLAEEATRTLGALRDAVRKLVGSSPTPIRRAADLQRALGVDAPLGWQIFRLAIAADPLAAVLYIPRAGSMAKVLRRALEAGFERQPVAATEAAYAAFEALVGRV